MEVEADVILTSEGLQMPGLESKLKELRQSFRWTQGKDIALKCVFSLRHKRFKSNSQLGYLMGHLAPLALQYLRDCGWFQIKTKEDAISFLKSEIGLSRSYFNDFTGEESVKLISLSQLTQDEMNESILMLSEILTSAGYDVMDPAEYKSHKNGFKGS